MTFTSNLKQIKQILKGNKNLGKYDGKTIVWCDSLNLYAFGSNFLLRFELIGSSDRNTMNIGYYFLHQLTRSAEPLYFDLSDFDLTTRLLREKRQSYESIEWELGKPWESGVSSKPQTRVYTSNRSWKKLAPYFKIANSSYLGYVNFYLDVNQKHYDVIAIDEKRSFYQREYIPQKPFKDDYCVSVGELALNFEDWDFSSEWFSVTRSADGKYLKLRSYSMMVIVETTKS